MTADQLPDSNTSVLFLNLSIQLQQAAFVPRGLAPSRSGSP